MAKPDFEQVKNLREETGAGFNLCRAALEESEGDMDKAMEYIREKGAAKAEEREDKETTEGVIGVYIHGVDQKTAALVEVNCETDFVARNEDFRDLAHKLAMQVAAMCPRYVSKDDVPESDINDLKKAIKDSKELKDKPKNIVEKIVEGKLEKFYSESCLLEQNFFMNEDITIQDLVNETVAKLGEKIVVRRIYRMTVGG